MVNQTTNFSPHNTDISLEQCNNIDKLLFKSYCNWLQLLHYDAKHDTFLPPSLLGKGINSFLIDFMVGILWESEVYLNNSDSTAVTLQASLTAAQDQRHYDIFMGTAQCAMSMLKDFQDTFQPSQSIRVIQGCPHPLTLPSRHRRTTEMNTRKVA